MTPDRIIPAEDTDASVREAPPKIIYHYCGVDAFYGIVGSKKLWLSHAAFTNDYTEQKWLIEKAYKALPKTSAPSDSLAQLRGMLENANIPYLFCLSSKRDLLSQWRAYSDDGAGFAIGFSGSEIEALCTECFRKTNFAIAPRKVKYKRTEQVAQLSKYLDAYSQDLPDYPRSSSKRAAISIWNLAAVCKNPGFREECEWRIVLMPQIVNMGEYDTIATSPMMFRRSGRGIVPYFTLSFSPGMIKEIDLGPKNYARKNRRPLDMFLQDRGYNVEDIKVRKSKVTYR